MVPDWTFSQSATGTAAPLIGEGPPVMDVSRISARWAVAIFEPARSRALRICMMQPGFVVTMSSAPVAMTAAVAVAELFGRTRLDEVVDTGGATAEVITDLA